MCGERWPQAWALGTLSTLLLVCLPFFPLFCVAAQVEDEFSKWVQDCRGGNQEACARLAQFAKGNGDWRLRQTAVEELTDQALLADIARSASDGSVRKVAVGKVTDETLLADIAKMDTDARVREEAVRRLRDETLLADVARSASDGYVREVAVGKLTDQAVLADIARSASDRDVRQAAIRQSVQSVRKRVRGCTSSAEKLRTWLTSGPVRVASSLFFLDEIASASQAHMQRQANDVARSALRSMGLNLAEGESPAQVTVEVTAVGTARGEYYSGFGGRGETRYSAARWEGFFSIYHSGGCVYSQNFDVSSEAPVSVSSSAYKTPSSAPFEEVLADSLGKVTVRLAEDLFGQAGIARIAKADRYDAVRGAAVAKLIDQALLADIAKMDTDARVRERAVRMLSDQGVLADIAKMDTDTRVREEAVRRLRDETLLADIARSASDGSVESSMVRVVAVGKLSDQAVLAQIAKMDTDARVRETAVRMLSDQAVLADIARTDKDESVRRAAQRRLEQLQK